MTYRAAMEDRDATKLRLLREAVQHNIHGPRRARPKASVRPTHVLPVWMAGCFLIASLVYLSLPSRAGSRVPTAPADFARPVSSEAMPQGDHGQPPDFSRLAPQRLARAVLSLSVKRVVLDPGHGGAQAGAIADSGVAEKQITLDIALRLRRLLQSSPFEVLLTREADATLSLEQRVAFANANRADLFVSIHVNWIPRRDIRPVETYYAGPTDDPAALRLARAENSDSGYSLAAYRRLLEKIYIDTRRDESHLLARAINAELYRALRLVNPGIENRGVKMAPFAVLVGTDMPAILVEVSCLSNEEEVGLLTNADYREQIALALLRGIRSYVTDLDGVGRKEG